MHVYDEMATGKRFFAQILNGKKMLWQTWSTTSRTKEKLIKIIVSDSGW